MPRKTKFGGDPPVPQKVLFEVKNPDKRYNEWLECVMIRGASGLADPFKATRTLESMGDEYLCPGCDKKMCLVRGAEYRCTPCDEVWIVTLLPRVPEFPSWPLSNYWPELRETFRQEKRKGFFKKKNFNHG